MQEPLGDMGSIPWSPWCPGSGRSPRGGNVNPLQYSYLENSMHRGAWRAIVHGVTKNQIRLNTHTHTHTHTHPFKKISHICFCASKTNTWKSKHIKHENYQLLIHYPKKTTFVFQLQFEFKIFTLKLHFEEIIWIVYYMPIFSALPYFLAVPFTVE